MRTLLPQVLFESDEILALNKPAGLPTHSVGEGKLGFAEYAESCFQFKLWVVHRLDKETSGVVIFAKSKEAAAKWSEYFEKQEIQKEYLLLLSQSISNEARIVETHIRKAEKHWESTSNFAPNSYTKFEPQDHEGLWCAKPKSGKTHQIRLHALELGGSILGDELYGQPSSFPRLALHAHSICAPAHQMIKAPLPQSFLKPTHSYPKEWLVQAEMRQALLFPKPDESYRVVSLDKLRMDVFGQALWVYDYDDQAKAEQVKSFACELGLLHWCLQKMQDRGQAPTERNLETSENFPLHWIANENKVAYEFRKEQGLSPGLFVDQRENRLWVREQAKGKKVLNLFAYTAGFSINAALGGAREVTTVDLSKNFIQWSKDNFNHNGLKPEDYEFWAADSFFFLDRAKKKNRKFDLIICDPPSFSRSKTGVFRIKQDIGKLISLMQSVLAPEGKILLSTNYEGWDQKSFKLELRKQTKLKIKELPPTAPDVWVNGGSLMKCVLLGL